MIIATKLQDHRIMQLKLLSA